MPARLTADALTTSAHEYDVPPHLIDGLVRYVTDGLTPEHFLMAVLENNLMGAMGRADEASRAGLFALCQCIYNDLPASCHGSRERVAEWIEAGGVRQFNAMLKAREDGQ